MFRANDGPRERGSANMVDTENVIQEITEKMSEGTLSRSDTATVGAAGEFACIRCEAGKRGIRMTLRSDVSRWIFIADNARTECPGVHPANGASSENGILRFNEDFHEESNSRRENSAIRYYSADV